MLFGVWGEVLDLNGSSIDQIVVQAKHCHTKVAWDAFFRAHEKALESTQHSWLIEDVFKFLRQDSGHLNYGSSPWSILLRGCINTWNVDLAKEIYKIAAKIPSASIAIPAAKIFLESGQPSVARDIAQKALRLVNVSTGDKLRLETIVARSFAEEGKQDRALKGSEKIISQLNQIELSEKERVDFLESLARLYFFLGSYTEAAKLFEDATPLYLNLQEWESAAKMLFNAAACFHNRGGQEKEKAFALVERCRQIAEEHQLSGPLAHCEAFYGVEALHLGQYANAKDHFRRGLKELPATDKSYRRLQILSMLTLTYFGAGRFDMAQKFGQQTLDLVALDKSARIHGRYVGLKAEMMWERGEFEESTEYLKTEIELLRTKGIHKLEDLMTVTQFMIQSALLGGNANESIQIDPQLQNDQYAWINYLYAKALTKLTTGSFETAHKFFNDCLNKSRARLDLNHTALCLIGIIQVNLAKKNLKDCFLHLEELEVVLGKIGSCPHKARVQILRAAMAYQTGNFEEAVKQLKNAEKNPYVSAFDRFCVHSCLETISGKSPKMVHNWQKRSVAWFVRTLFAPSLKLESDKTFLISDHYRINLERHPVLADLLYFLMSKSNFSASSEEIQIHVWKESLNHQGWQQKIRNSIMRLRDQSIYSIAPLIDHQNEIRIFSEALSVVPIATKTRNKRSSESSISL